MTDEYISRMNISEDSTNKIASAINSKEAKDIAERSEEYLIDHILNVINDPNYMNAQEAIDLRKNFRDREVVRGATIKIARGEVVGLLGPNGAGKTTCFYMIVGLIKPQGGTIYIDKQDITTFPMYMRAQNGIGYLAQEASVFRKLSVEQNILSVLQLTKLSKKQQKLKVEALVEEFGLTHIRKNRGDLLSGGERRRTEIARALATDPKFVLLDEPFAGVDPLPLKTFSELSHTLRKKI